jgi:Ni/Co efflux regulator RcnB
MMRKFVLTLAAFSAVGLVLPVTTSARAEDAKVEVRDHDHHDRYRDHEHRRVVIVNHHRHHHDDHYHD